MDPFFIIIAVALALFIFMQFRTGKKRRDEAAKLQERMLPGTEIMTNYGLYGTIVSINEETNEAEIETTPGTVLRIHRQTILKVVEDETPVENDADALEEDTAADPIVDLDAAPEFGERLNPADPSPKSGKKGDE